MLSLDKCGLLLFYCCSIHELLSTFIKFSWWLTYNNTEFLSKESREIKYFQQPTKYAELQFQFYNTILLMNITESCLIVESTSPRKEGRLIKTSALPFKSLVPLSYCRLKTARTVLRTNRFPWKQLLWLYFFKNTKLKTWQFSEYNNTLSTEIWYRFSVP